MYQHHLHLMHISQHQVAQSQSIKLAQGNQAVSKLHVIRGMVRLQHGKMSNNGRARVMNAKGVSRGNCYVTINCTRRSI
jgi:hypothetical protein